MTEGGREREKERDKHVGNIEHTVAFKANRNHKSIYNTIVNCLVIKFLRLFFPKHVQIFNMSSQNRRHYMFSCMLFPFNNISWECLQIKTFISSVFLCFLKNTNFAQENILILLHLSIMLDIFTVPSILIIRVTRRHTLPQMIKTAGSPWSWSLSLTHTCIHTITSQSIAQIA